MASWLEKSRSPEYSPAKLSQMLAEVEAVIGISELDEAMSHETIITGGYLNTHLIKAKSIIAEHMDVGSLSAISANIGDVTSGTITGAFIRTGASGDRLELSGKTLRGYSSTEQKAIEIDGTQFRFFDWEGTSRTEPTGMVYSTRRNHDANMPGISIASGENSYLSIGFEEGGVYHPYVTFDKHLVTNSTGDRPIGFHYPVRFGNSIYTSQIGFENTAGYGFIYATGNKLVLRSGYSGFAIIDRNNMAAMSLDVANDMLDFAKNSRFAKGLMVVGSKNSLQKTKSYGERLINAYETAEYYFGDIGSGIINDDGECVVYLDEIFQETVNTNISYHVFTQIYSGEITSISREKSYFVVYGEPNTEFSWEIKAKRLGYENHRLEQPDLFHESSVCDLDEELTEESKEDTELKDILEKELSMMEQRASLLLQN